MPDLRDTRRSRWLRIIVIGCLILLGASALCVWLTASQLLDGDDLLQRRTADGKQTLWRAEYYPSHTTLSTILTEEDFEVSEGPALSMLQGEESVNVGDYKFDRYERSTAVGTVKPKEGKTWTYQSFGPWHRIYVFVLLSDEDKNQGLMVHQKVGVQMLLK